MTRITAADLFDEVDVDLWGTEFRLREGTRSVQTKLATAQDAIKDIDETDPDAMAAAVIALLDALLEPVANGDGKRTHAKTVLDKQWKADKLGLDRLLAISDQIQKAVEDRGRPSSPTANSE